MIWPHWQGRDKSDPEVLGHLLLYGEGERAAEREKIAAFIEKVSPKLKQLAERIRLKHFDEYFDG
jgi:hypothetical protein